MVHRCEFLKKCPFLDPLSNEQIGKLAGALESCSFESDDYIIRQGDIGDCFYIIEEGQVKCTQMKSSGREVELLYGLSPPSLPSSLTSLQNTSPGRLLWRDGPHVGRSPPCQLYRSWKG
jgi:hypothetical protein